MLHDEKESFKCRWFDEAYVDEGQYEFRANLTAAHDLSVTESFAASDHKKVVLRANE